MPLRQPSPALCHRPRHHRHRDCYRRRLPSPHRRCEASPRQLRRHPAQPPQQRNLGNCVVSTRCDGALEQGPQHERRYPTHQLCQSRGGRGQRRPAIGSPQRLRSAVRRFVRVSTSLLRCSSRAWRLCRASDVLGSRPRSRCIACHDRRRRRPRRRCGATLRSTCCSRRHSSVSCSLHSRAQRVSRGNGSCSPRNGQQD
jgi:hypothetical protein